MKNIIRPSGFMAFIGITGLIAAFWILAADWLVKTAIEEGGSAAVGAKVELDGADLSFSPFGISLTNLQVTDPENPMQNLVQLKQIDAHVALGKLLMGQVIFEDLIAEGVQLNTPRATSGALPIKRKAASQEQSAEEDPSVDLSALQNKLPSVDEVLEREPLSTLTVADSFKDGVATSGDRLDRSFDALPDDAAFQQYQQKIDEITSGKVTSVDDLKKRKAALSELKDSIRQDKEALAVAKKEISVAKADLGEQYKNLKAAPGQDLETIKTKYSLSSENIGNISGLLFGDQAQEWIDKIQPWVGQLQQLSDGESEKEPPPPPRGTGRFIQFPAAENLPEVLVRKAKLGIETVAGNIVVSLEDVTHQPEVLGRPIRLAAVGDDMPSVGQLQIDGVFDHVDPKAAIDKLSWSVSDWSLNQVQLSGSSKLALAMEQAQSEMKGELVMKDGALEGVLNSTFAQVSWAGEGEKSGTITKMLTGIDNFTIDADISGKPFSPRFKLHSDLDEKLKGEFSRKIKQRQSELEKGLKAKLDGKVEEVAGPYRQRLEEINKREEEIKARIALAEEMLKAEVKGAVETKKQETKDKLKDKLKGLKF